ncbi:MAG: hypothetical protein JXR85_02270, partial [Deltaproteobacteria bacterium]|nr:hypothetical protein [Deltaproteobacteria bacterium]
ILISPPSGSLWICIYHSFAPLQTAGGSIFVNGSPLPMAHPTKRGSGISRNPLIFMVGGTGFEPVTVLVSD